MSETETREIIRYAIEPLLGVPIEFLDDNELYCVELFYSPDMSVFDGLAIDNALNGIPEEEAWV